MAVELATVSISTMHRHKSKEFLSTGHHAPSRAATMPSAVFSLVCTIIGGGIMSLPYAFAKAGIVLGPLMMLASALMSDFSVFLLVAASRRTGANSYEDVVKAAFGDAAHATILVLLVLLLVLCIIAYMVLLNGLFTPVFEFAADTRFTLTESCATTAGLLVFIMPFCLMKSMSQLRFVSMVAVFAMLLLGFSVGYRAIDSFPPKLSGLVLVSDNYQDILFAFPVILVSYLCHFNVLPMHNELIDPTRSRLVRVFHWVILVCTCLYLSVGILGLLEFWHIGLCPSILANYPSHDKLITVGRCGVGMTVLLSMPLLVQPCRRTIAQALLLAFKMLQKRNPHTVGVRLDNDVSDLDVPDDDADKGSILWHTLQTTLLMGVCFVIAFSVPNQNVTVVWSLLGSTISILIMFILPSASYLKIRAHKKFNIRKFGAWFLLIFGCIAMVACTYQAIHDLVHLTTPPSQCSKTS